MKKSSIKLLLVGLLFTIFSCGTSEKEKHNYETSAKKFLRDTMTDSLLLETTDSVNNPLTFIGEVTIPARKSFNPKKVFSTDVDDEPIANFYHGGNFKKWLYDNAVPVPAIRGFTLKIYQANRSVPDWEIEKYTKSTPLSEGELHHVMAYLISNQSNGTAGKLTTSTWNIFQVKRNNDSAVAVFVRWHSLYDRWYSNAHEFNSWVEGGLVFVRGN